MGAMNGIGLKQWRRRAAKRRSCFFFFFSPSSLGKSSDGFSLLNFQDPEENFALCSNHFFFVLFLLGRIRRLEQKASAAGLEKQVGKLMTCMSFWPQADIKAIRPENTHVITKRASTKNALPREYIVRPHFFFITDGKFYFIFVVFLNSNKKFFFRTRKKLDCPGWTRVWVYPWVPAAGK